MDTNGNLYVADTYNHTIRKIKSVGTNWVVTTIAGAAQNGYGSTDGTNGAAQFYYPYGITVDTNGNLYVADTDNNAIRKITPVGTNWVTVTIAGTAGSAGGGNDGTNGGAQFDKPSGIAVDGADNLFVTDYNGDIIRKVTPVGTNWVTTTIAGTYQDSDSADGTNSAALFNNPFGIAVDGADNLYVADASNDTIRKITPVGANWVTATIGGMAGDGNSADGMSTNALFNFPCGIAVNSVGSVFVADTGNYTIRLGRVAAVPKLSLAFTAPDSVTVSWPNTGGYTLQTNPDLTTTNWSNYGGAITTSNGTNSVTITPALGNLFFRMGN